MKRYALTLFLASISTITCSGVVPEQCPSVSAIAKKKPWFATEYISFDGMASVMSPVLKFDTNDAWLVVVWVDNATDKMDAQVKAKQALANMTLTEGLTPIRSTAWSCSYRNNAGYIIRAVHANNPWLRKEIRVIR